MTGGLPASGFEGAWRACETAEEAWKVRTAEHGIEELKRSDEPRRERSGRTALIVGDGSCGLVGEEMREKVWGSNGKEWSADQNTISRFSMGRLRFAMLVRNSILRTCRLRLSPATTSGLIQQSRFVETVVWLPPKAVAQEELAFPYRRDSTMGNNKGPKRPYNGADGNYARPGKKQRQAEKRAESKRFEGGAEEVLVKDIELVKERDVVPLKEGETAPELPEKFSNVNVTITHLGSGGDGLGVTEAKDRIYLVPFSLPGDEVEARVVFHDKDHTRCDFIKVIKPSPQRDDKRVGCQYFSVCGGCQFQMMSYEDQLEFKREILVRAYKNFSGIAPELLPEFGPTMPSPKEYSYRTKLSPHFDGPMRGGWKEGVKPVIGFMMKGRRQNIEIEDCPIGTQVLRDAIPGEKKFVMENLNKVYKRGATLLLRESTERITDENGDVEVENVDGTLSKFFEKKLALRDQKAITTEYIGRFKFNFLAGDFFQNNNSILKPVRIPRPTHLLHSNTCVVYRLCQIEPPSSSPWFGCCLLSAKIPRRCLLWLWTVLCHLWRALCRCHWRRRLSGEHQVCSNECHRQRHQERQVHCWKGRANFRGHYLRPCRDFSHYRSVKKGL